MDIIQQLLNYGILYHSPDVMFEFEFKESSYEFSEGDGIVEVCTVITNVPAEGIGSDITLFFSAIEGTNAGMLFIIINIIIYIYIYLVFCAGQYREPGVSGFL